MAAVEWSNSGFSHSSCSSRGGNCLERREKERRKRESLTDQRTVSQALVRSLNSIVDGSDPRILEMTRKLQILQPIAVPSIAKGSLNPENGSPTYVGITPHPSHRLEVKEKENKEKEQN